MDRRRRQAAEKRVRDLIGRAKAAAAGPLELFYETPAEHAGQLQQPAATAEAPALAALAGHSKMIAATLRTPAAVPLAAISKHATAVAEETVTVDGVRMRWVLAMACLGFKVRDPTTWTMLRHDGPITSDFDAVHYSGIIWP